MSETPRLNLPLLLPSQAQKHVTVNEALTRLDGLAQLCLVSRSVVTPPDPVPDGDCYLVPAGATGAWAGQSGSIAIGTNGGWTFVAPGHGWRAFIADEGVPATHADGAWKAGALTCSASGAAARLLTVEFEHDLVPGTNTTGQGIPADAMVFAVSARVTVAITGSATSWRLGTAGADDRFGAGMGLGQGAYATGLLSAPVSYYAATPLVVTPEGGDFAGGRLRLAMHYFALDLPEV